MPGESKTEKATPKKRRDERKKGNVLMSRDAAPVITLFGGAAILKFFGGFISDRLTDFYEYVFIQVAEPLSFLDILPELFIRVLWTIAAAVMPLALTVVILSVSITLFQTRLLVTTEPLKPKFSRLSPLQGIKRLVSLRSLIEALKNTLKIGILIYLIYTYFVGIIGTFGRMLDMEVAQSCQILFDDAFSLVLQIAVAFLVIAFLDYLYQWWDFERQLKMTKQEIKEEYKQLEGDPKVKGKIKEAQRKIAMSRMMQQVPESDVVIRNPTHFAVALRYKPDIDNAPIVMAKGADELAQRIVGIAEEHKISVVENVPLARALYAQAELNREIPPDFYGPVAEVMVYILQLDQDMPNP